MTIRWLRAVAALMAGAAFSTGVAFGAPVTLPLNYVADDGNPDITISGSVTYDDAIQTPNQDIFGDTTGLIAVTITVQGPGVPGGSTTFTEADGMTWAFRTDNASRIIDLNFFSTNNGSGCFVDGFEVFLLGFYCDPEDEEDYLTLKRLVLVGPSATPVPALEPAALALLAMLIAALATAVPALRRRR